MSIRHGNGDGSKCPLWWRLHFGTNDYDKGDRRVQLVAYLSEWLKRSRVDGQSKFASGPRQLQLGWRGRNGNGDEAVSGPYVVVFDCNELLQSSESYDLKAALEFQPEEALLCISAAVCSAIFCDKGDMDDVMRQRKQNEQYECQITQYRTNIGSQGVLGNGNIEAEAENFLEDLRRKKVDRVLARLVNMIPEFCQPIQEIGANVVDHLVSITGVVVRVWTSRPLLTAAEFICNKCQEKTRVDFKFGRFDPPERCGMKGCRGKTLTLDRTSAVCVDWQRFRIQEQQQNESMNFEGRMPCSIECEVTNDLTELCSAGERVTVVGLVKRTLIENFHKGKFGKNENANMYTLYIHACSVKVIGKSGSDMPTTFQEGETGYVDPRSSAPPSTKFSEKDLRFIAKFGQEYEGDQLRQLTHSLCPDILGNELIKTGMILSLIGGIQKNSGENGRIPVRGDIHMLIVGDPGLGKSQMLRAAKDSAPRGIYVCGKGTTAAGLTAAVGRGAESGGHYQFEAGALVLADRGVCCVDEFDKLSAKPQSLLEAMEQQSVSIAKAGLTASLPSRAAIIAAANPVKGHYDRSRTVNENIKLSNAMLSRFDLVFVLLDEPDECIDKHLSEHLLAIHSGNADRTLRAHQNLLEYGRRSSQLLEAPRGIGTSPLTSRKSKLEDKLKLRPQEEFSPLPKQLMRTYIAYVRRYVFPTLSEDAKKVLKDFYLELRASARLNDGTPITARQLESMVRLSEARTRIELRTEVTKEDALDVVEIMRASLLDKLVDERGFIDFRRSGGKSKQAEARRFMLALRHTAQEKQDSYFSEAELCDLADHVDLGVPDIRSFIDMLNDSGELLKQGPGKYKISR